MNNTINKLVIGLVASAGASLIAFASTPIAIHMLGDLRFSQLSVWLIYVAFIQLFDFGLTQYAVKLCASTNKFEDKHDIIKQSTSSITCLVYLLLIVSIIIPKPSIGVYNSYTNIDWLLFKFSIIINLQLIHHQSMLVMLNRQHQYTMNQIAQAVSRYLIPVMIYFWQDDLTLVFVYQFLAALAMSIFGAFQLDLPIISVLKPTFSVKVIGARIYSSVFLYLSSASAVLLGVLDRLIASYILQPTAFTLYVASFTLASSINIIVLPFSRIYTANLRPVSRKFNQKNALRITAVQSYACLLSVGFIYLFSDDVLTLLGVDYPIDARVLVMISLSLWGIANGWIIATEIILNHRPAFQAILIIFAMACYLIFLKITDTYTIFNLTFIWIFHGILQTFVGPVWLTGKFRLKRYMFWQRHVVVLPFISIATLCIFVILLEAFHGGLAIIAFLCGSSLVAFLIYRKGVFDKFY